MTTAIVILLAVLPWQTDGRIDTSSVVMDFNGDGAVDLIDVMAAQVRGLDPMADWEPMRKLVRAVEIRTRNHWDCRAMVHVGTLAIEWAQGIEANIYVRSGNRRLLLFREQADEEVIWLQVPDGPIVEIDVMTLPQTVVVGPNGVGVR